MAGASADWRGGVGQAGYMNCLKDAWIQHASELRGWATRRLDNPAVTEDFLQDLFLKALQQGERFCAVKKARAWLFEVARNALADRRRVKRETVELPDDLVAPQKDIDTVDQLTCCLPRVLSELAEDDHIGTSLLSRCNAVNRQSGNAILRRGFRAASTLFDNSFADTS